METRHFQKVVPLLAVFHLQYSKYKGVKIWFYSCCYQNQNFSLMSHLCHRPVSLLKMSLSHRCFSNILLEKPTTWFLHKSNIGRKWVKKRLQHRCFPENFAIFLRAPCLQNTSGGCS